MADCIDTKSASRPSARPAARMDLIDLVMTWHDRARQRRALATLDPRLLRDIGLDPGSAAMEASKPFWRA